MMEAEILDIVDNDSWAETYRQICITSKLTNEFTTVAASVPENRPLNRYLDVSPYDHSRVHLRCLTKSGTDYINASLVKNERSRRNYILAQGPLDGTIGHFWSMVWHEGCQAVLMLNRLIEKGVKKCEQYWPRNPGEIMRRDDVDLEIENVQSESFDDYVLTTLYVTHLETGDTRKVLHFQYVAWPDFGVPRSPDSFLEFLNAVRKTGSLSEDAGPPVVHCSAGIGRSGTFCLVDASLVLIEEEGTDAINLKDMLLDLRSYRMGLIQTWEQLKFSFLAVVAGAKKSHLISSEFLSDRDVNVSGGSDGDGSPPLPPPRSESLPKAPSSSDPPSSVANGTRSGDVRTNGHDEVNSSLIAKTETNADASTTILNNHKMEERKREVQEQRRRQLKEEKKQDMRERLEEMKRKQRESEERRNNKSPFENSLPFCVGIVMVIAGVALYYYYGRSS